MKHEELVQKYYEKLERTNNYFALAKEINYGRFHYDDSIHTKGRTTGDIDLFGLIKKEDYRIIELYEMKTGKSISRAKALRQLDKSHRHLSENYLSVDDKVRKYFVYTQKNDDILERVD